MRILHVLSQFEITGAEVFAAQLSDQQIQSGDQVWIVSDTFHKKTNAKVIRAPIGKRSFPRRVKNIFFLLKLIRENRIQILHAHSRAAAWVSYFAGKLLRVPVLYTIHGRQHIHTSSKFFSSYGDHLVCVCENLKTHMKEELFVKDNSLSVCPNMISLPDLFHAENKEKVLFYGGRTTGPKGKRLESFLFSCAQSLLNQDPHLKIWVAGGEKRELTPEAQKKVSALESQNSDRFQFFGNRKDFLEKMNQATWVIGSGRVAMEAVLLQKNLFAVGESEVCGWIKSVEDLQEALKSNFGDCSAKKDKVVPADEDKVWEGLTLQETTSLPELKKSLENRVAPHLVTNKIQSFYSKIRLQKLQKKWIPVLMYHKVPDQELESKHKIYVSMDRFEDQMRVLKSLGFQSITFQDLKNFCEGKLEELPRKPILLTFDDGYEDNHKNAVPILEKYGFRGIFYVLSDFSMKSNIWDTDKDSAEPVSKLMTKEQILDLSKRGHEIGSHGMNHRSLLEFSAEELEEEIRNSKHILENTLEKKVLSFAYPFGWFSEREKKFVQQSGYDFAVSTDHGPMKLEDDFYHIVRVNIFPHDQFFQIFKKTFFLYRKYLRMKRKV